MHIYIQKLKDDEICHVDMSIVGLILSPITRASNSSSGSFPGLFRVPARRAVDSWTSPVLAEVRQ